MAVFYINMATSEREGSAYPYLGQSQYMIPGRPLNNLINNRDATYQFLFILLFNYFAYG